jgi:hypothetical protein
MSFILFIIIGILFSVIAEIYGTPFHWQWMIGFATGLSIIFIDRNIETREVVKCPHGWEDWNDCPDCCH